MIDVCSECERKSPRHRWGCPNGGTFPRWKPCGDCKWTDGGHNRRCPQYRMSQHQDLLDAIEASIIAQQDGE